MNAGDQFHLICSRHRAIAIAVLSVPVLLVVVAAQQAPTVPDLNPPAVSSQANLLPVVSPQMHESPAKTPADAMSAERRRQIAVDSAQMLKLATELKAEVDKTNKDTLSVAVVRKAGQIEHLAHGVKEKMKPAAEAGKR
jgi:hypothetical protein